MSEDIREAFERTRAAGIIAAGALDEVAKIIKPGITTNQIDNLCYEFINDNDACSAPLFYRGFPKSCCTSPNHTICHGIPGDKTLTEGDIINVDVTTFKNS
jgi:methionyl aminopeptidase